MGAGETAITIVAAAVGNAIFDATGVRIRELPFSPERVQRGARRGRGWPHADRWAITTKCKSPVKCKQRVAGSANCLHFEFCVLNYASGEIE